MSALNEFYKGTTSKMSLSRFSNDALRAVKKITYIYIKK